MSLDSLNSFIRSLALIIQGHYQQKCQTTLQWLYWCVVCLPIVVISINSMECLFAKMLPTGTKANSEADVPNEDNMSREAKYDSAGIREIHVLYAYIIQGEVGADCRHWQTRGVLLRTPCFHYSLKVCASSDVHKTRSKSSLWCCFIRRQPLRAAWHCCRGLFSAWNRMVNREHSRGWALQSTAVLIALLHTPTPFHTRSASDNRSVRGSSLSLPFFWACSYLSCLSISTVFFLLFTPCRISFTP